MSREPIYEIPDWCISGFGGSRVLVVAPHGGARRHSAAPPVPKRNEKPRRINDLHTADLAMRLAERLDASFVINRGMDRNLLDLNRISQVRKRAPWFLTALDRAIARLVRAHGDAQVLVVHGWNVNQGRCDLGVGADLSDQDADRSELTVSASFANDYLAALVAINDSGHRVTLGRRYPARHRDNLLQLFRHDGTRGADLPDALAAIVRAGQCQAVQLELGIPLRWPGPRREAFLARLVDVFTGSTARRSGAAPRRNLPAREATFPIQNAPTHGRRPDPAIAPGRSPRPAPGLPRALQAFDPHSGLALLASVDALPGGEVVFGRVALFLPDGRVGLYTGEADSPSHLADDGPAFRSSEGVIHLRFDGSMLLTPDGSDYVDLERAFDRSVLAKVEIGISYIPAEQQSHGRASGIVAVDGIPIPVETIGFHAAREAATWRGAGRAQWSVRAAFSDGSATVIRSARQAAAPRVESTKILLAGDGYAPEELSIATVAGTLVVRPLSRMSIARPVGPRRRARFTFGPAVLEMDGMSGTGYGLYEYARLIDR